MCEAGVDGHFADQFALNAAKSLLRCMQATPRLLQGWTKPVLIRSIPGMLVTANFEIDQQIVSLEERPETSIRKRPPVGSPEALGRVAGDWALRQLERSMAVTSLCVL